MDRIAEGIVDSLSIGPTQSIRDEINEHFNGFYCLLIQIKLHSKDIAAQTQNYLENSEKWSLRLCEAGEQNVWLDSGSNSSSSSNPSSSQSSMLYLPELRVSAPFYNNASPPSIMGYVIAYRSPGKSQIDDPVTLLARSLSNHADSIEQFANSVSSALFALPHTPPESPLHSDDEEFEDDDHDGDDGLPHYIIDNDDNPATNNSNNAGTSSPRNCHRIPSTRPTNTTNRRHTSHYTNQSHHRQDHHHQHQHSTQPSSITNHSLSYLSVWMNFENPQQERAFTRWHSQHMATFDALGIIICLLSHSFIVFMPKSSYRLIQRLPMTKWIFGYGTIPFLLVILYKRRWYIQHRDSIQFGALLFQFFYHHFILKNYYHIGPAILLQCSGVAYSYVWLTFVTLVHQMRFKLLAPTITCFTALNLSLLWDMCQDCQNTAPFRRCVGRGVSKVAMLVIAGLFVVYCIEFRARRVFLQSISSSSS